MKRIVVNRRQLLRGAGGFSLGLPFLPSLMPGPAYAVEYGLVAQPRFVSISTQHGAIKPENMYPSASPPATAVTIHPGHDAHWGALSASADGSYAKISNVIRAPSTVLTPKLVAKMNVMRGFDIPYYIGHHTGGHLGNFVRSDQGPQNLEPFATIDQFMAWSSTFYKDLSGIKLRSIVTGQNFQGDSFVWSNPQARSGTIQKVDVDTSSLSLFNKLFVPGGTTTPAAPPRKPIIDRVLQNYQSLRQSNRRLSADDKLRLDAHVAQLSELQRRVSVVPAPMKSCGSYTKPTDDSSSHQKDSPLEGAKDYQLLNDVIAMAFACGTSRVATLHCHLTFSDYSGNWHQDVAHQWQDAGKQMILVAGLQKTFEGAIVDLAAKLDAIEESPGVSVLDNTLYQWTQESGWSTHDAQDMPIVTFGSAAGYFKTGMFVDFRNVGSSAAHLDIFGKQQQTCGLWVRQWLATALQAMGIPPSEFEKNGKTGYGDAYYSPSYAKAVHSDVIDKASDPVPIVAAR
jgi:hypothetical protein